MQSHRPQGSSPRSIHLPFALSLGTLGEIDLWVGDRTIEEAAKNSSWQLLIGSNSPRVYQVIGVLVGVKIESHRESKSNSMIDVV
jgi:hypothetical protein